MLNAMFCLARSGAGWEDFPERYGPWKTVYSRFCKWRDDGTLLLIFQSLNEDADMENLSLDSTVIKAHPHSAGAVSYTHLQGIRCRYSRKEHGSNNKLYSKPVKEG